MTNVIFAAALAFAQQQGGQAAQQAEGQVMSGGGWLFMSAAWVFILVLVFYTFSKVLRGKKS